MTAYFPGVCVIYDSVLTLQALNRELSLLFVSTPVYGKPVEKYTAPPWETRSCIEVMTRRSGDFFLSCTVLLARFGVVFACSHPYAVFAVRSQPSASRPRAEAGFRHL